MKDSLKPTNTELKKFAFIWAIIFLVIGLYPVIKGKNIQEWAIAIFIAFLIIGLLKPEIVASFYKIWVKIGNFIGGVISKIILFILFYLLFTPIALVLKLAGKDLLHKKLDKSIQSYWNQREHQPGSMKNQF